MLRRTLFQWTSALAITLVGATVLTTVSASTHASTPSTTLIAQANDIEELNFGIISTESQANQKPIWEPFIEAMSDELGIQVNAFYATQYAGIIEAMRFEEVDIAWFGGKSYIEAAERSNAEAFASTIADDGSKGYVSHLITNADNPIVVDAKAMGGDDYIIENAAELSFAFNDPNSTSGFLVPSYYIFAQNGVDPNAAFRSLVFSGSHEATALAVANNQVDVATNNNESLQRLETTNPEAREKIEVIWTSPEIPSDPIAYRETLPDDLKEQIRDFFYTYDDESVLAPLQWSGFEPADDGRWNTIRELELAKQILEVENNTSMNEADKEARLDELNQQLEAVK